MKIREADRLVLPGVGAFGNCLDGLRQHSLIYELMKFYELERPFLGICVGMQLMLETSGEFGEHRGFGWIEGDVVRIPTKRAGQPASKIPHIGWNSLEPPECGTDWRGTVLDGIEPRSYAYFVHSYAARPAHKTVHLCDTNYNGLRICAAITKGSLTGTQFHPEKSGSVGLQIIRNFIAK